MDALMICVFAVMDFGAAHVYLVPMPRKSMGVIAYWCAVYTVHLVPTVYNGYHTTSCEKNCEKTMDYEKMNPVLIFQQQSAVGVVPFVRKPVKWDREVE